MRPDEMKYDDIVRELGPAIPCYDKRDGALGGCYGSESLDCNDGCWLLKMYLAGYAAAERALSEQTTVK